MMVLKGDGEGWRGGFHTEYLLYSESLFRAYQIHKWLTNFKIFKYNWHKHQMDIWTFYQYGYLQRIHTI